MSLLNVFPNFPDFAMETGYINKILKELAIIYLRLINQYIFEYHTLFSASFYKINEEDQRSDEIEFFFSLIISHYLTETDFEKIDVKCHIEHEIEVQETEKSGFIFDKNNTMKSKFFDTGELNGSIY